MGRKRQKKSKIKMSEEKKMQLKQYGNRKSQFITWTTVRSKYEKFVMQHPGHGIKRESYDDEQSDAENSCCMNADTDGQRDRSPSTESTANTPPRGSQLTNSTDDLGDSLPGQLKKMTSRRHESVPKKVPSKKPKVASQQHTGVRRKCPRTLKDHLKIGSQMDNWRQLKDSLHIQSDIKFAKELLDGYMHRIQLGKQAKRWHCLCGQLKVLDEGLAKILLDCYERRFNNCCLWDDLTNLNEDYMKTRLPNESPAVEETVGSLLVNPGSIKVEPELLLAPGVNNGEQELLLPPGVNNGEQELLLPPGVNNGEQELLLSPGVNNGEQELLLPPGVNNGEQEQLLSPGVNNGEQELRLPPGVNNGEQELLLSPSVNNSEQELLLPPGVNNGEQELLLSPSVNNGVSETLQMSCSNAENESDCDPEHSDSEWESEYETDDSKSKDPDFNPESELLDALVKSKDKESGDSSESDLDSELNSSDEEKDKKNLQEQKTDVKQKKRKIICDESELDVKKKREYQLVSINDGRNSRCHIEVRDYIEVVFSDTSEILETSKTLPENETRPGENDATKSKLGRSVKYRCTACGIEKEKLDNLIVHIRRVEIYQPCVCEYCGEVCSNPSKLCLHRQRHLAQPVECTYDGCTHRSLKAQMKQHVAAVHLKTRSYVCDWQGCEKRFNAPNALVVHKRIHSDLKPFLCYLCAYRGRQKSALNWHMKSKHPDAVHSKAYNFVST